MLDNGIGFNYTTDAAFVGYVYEKAVKAGKRMRFALLDGEPTVEAAGAFVDRILGGDAKFTKISDIYSRNISN